MTAERARRRWTARDPAWLVAGWNRTDRAEGIDVYAVEAVEAIERDKIVAIESEGAMAKAK